MKTAKTIICFYSDMAEDNIELGSVLVNDFISSGVAVTVRKYHKLRDSLLIFSMCSK